MFAGIKCFFVCFKTLFGLGIDSFHLKNNPQKLLCYLYPPKLKKKLDIKGTPVWHIFIKKNT